MIDEARRQAALRALNQSDEALRSECEETFYIASGPGGQHRNTTESGVRLSHAATGLTVTATERRSQLMNRSAALERLREGLRALCVVQKVRRPTKPSKGSKRRRLDSKKRLSEKKQNRRTEY